MDRSFWFANVSWPKHFATPRNDRLVNLIEQIEFSAARIALLHVSCEVARFFGGCFAIKIRHHVFRAMTNRSFVNLFHLYTSNCYAFCSPNFCSRICNCLSAVYSRLLTVLSGTSSTSDISWNVSSSNSFITTTCRKSGGNADTARLTATLRS